MLLFTPFTATWKMHKSKKTVAFSGECWYNIFCYGVWRSLVARTAGGREVAGSNPVAPIKSSKIKSLERLHWALFYLLFDYLWLSHCFQSIVFMIFQCSQWFTVCNPSLPTVWKPPVSGWLCVTVNVFMKYISLCYQHQLQIESVSSEHRNCPGCQFRPA